MATAGSTAATVSVSVAAVDSSSGNSPGPISASSSERTPATVGQRSAAVLSGGTNGVMQYLNPDYSPPASLSLDSKNSPLAMLARTCNNIGKDLVMSCGSRSAISQLHQAALHHQSGHSVVSSNNFVVNTAPESSKAISPLGGSLLPRKPATTSLSRPDLLTSSLRHHEPSTISRPAATHHAHTDIINVDRNIHVTSPRRPLQVDSSTSVVRQSAAYSKHSSYVNNRRTTTGTGSRQHHVAGDVDATHYCNNRRPSLPQPPSNNGGSKLITDRFVVSQHKNANQHHHQTGNGNTTATDEIDVVEDDDDVSAVPSRDDEDSNGFTVGAEIATDTFQNRFESDFQTVDAAIRRESIQRLLQSHDAIALQAAAFAAATAAAATSPYPSPQTMPSRYSAGISAALPPYPLPGGRFPPVAELNSPALYSAFLAAAAAAQQQYLNHVTAGRHYGGSHMAPTGSSVAGSAGISSNSSASSASSPENSCNSNRLERAAPLPATNSPFADDVTMEDQQQNGDNDCPSSTTVVTSGGASGDSESTVNYGQCNCALPSIVDYSNEQQHDSHRHHHVSQHSIRKRHQPPGGANKTTQHYQQQLADSLGQTFESSTADSTRAVSSIMLQTAAAAAAAAAAGRFQPMHTGNVADLQPSLSCNWVTSSGEFCGRRFATGNELLHHLQSHVVCNEQHPTAHDVDHVTAAILAAGLFQSPLQPAAATVAGNVPSIHSLRMLGATAAEGHHLSATAAAAAAVEALNQNQLAGLQSLHGAFHCNNSLLHGSNRTTAGRRSPRTATGCGKSPPPPPSSMSAAAAASGSLLLHAAAMAAAAARYHPYKWPASAFQETRNTHSVGSGPHSVVQPSAYLQNATGSLPFGALYPPGLGAVVGPKC